MGMAEATGAPKVRAPKARAAARVLFSVLVISDPPIRMDLF
jgi:hypothetical protein